jgi:SAM-dependent methyltransferase
VKAIKRAIKRALQGALPLPIRKQLVVRIGRTKWIPSAHRAYWATEILKDFAERDVNEYHKFLWTHHLAYAETYEVDQRFGYDKFNESRRVLFGELPKYLADARASAEGIRSVLEVGCSLGYLLRYIETDLFKDAERLDGIDIDAHAIREGARHLASLGSRVSLVCGDMESIDRHYADTGFDVVLASGVLLYLDQASADRFVQTLLTHTRKLLIVTALAHPEVDNRQLETSVRRASDGTWIHNVDAMIAAAGARLLGRRWEGGRIVDGNTIYFLYAAPGGGRS